MRKLYRPVPRAGQSVLVTCSEQCKRCPSSLHLRHQPGRAVLRRHAVDSYPTLKVIVSLVNPFGTRMRTGNASRYSLL